MNQRLSREIINLIPHLPKEFEDYTKKIKKAGYEITLTTFRHLYEIDTSYYIEKSSTDSYVINAFVHIPVSQKDNLFEVFTYVPSIMPFSLNMKHGLKVTEGSEGDTIAINEKKNLFVTFNSQKLSECKKVASIHICTNIDSTWSMDTIGKSIF